MTVIVYHAVKRFHLISLLFHYKKTNNQVRWIICISVFTGKGGYTSKDVTSILTYDSPQLSAGFSPCTQPISCTYRILLISASLRLWTIQCQQKTHLPTDLMNKPTLKWARMEQPNAREDARKPTQTQVHAVFPWPHIHTNTITTAVVIWGLVTSVKGWRHVVRAEQSCEENTDAQGKQCWQWADSVVAP